MRKDTIYILRTTLFAMCFGCGVYAVSSWRERMPSPGTVLLQNTLHDTDEVKVFDRRLSTYVSTEGRPPLFALHSQEAKALAQSLVLNETPNMMATYGGPYEFRFIKAHKVLARLFYNKGGLQSDIRWPNGAAGAQYGSLVGPLNPRSRTDVDGVLRRHNVLPLPPMR